MGIKHSNQTSSPEKLKEKDIQFLLANTVFDREEINEWNKEFLREAPNGKLTKAQFQKICQPDTNDNAFSRYTSYAFQIFDRDKSGYINFVEFVVSIAQLSSGDMKANLLLTFKMYDLDGNGTISKRELTLIIKALYKLRGIKKFHGDDRPSTRVKLIFEKYDKSKDNRISESEFLNACTSDPLIRALLTSC